MENEQTKCLMCDQMHVVSGMRSVPKGFVPAAHFLFSCKQYVRQGMYLSSWKFFIGPVLADLEVRGGTPVCPACRRVTILSAIALYLLVVGGVVVVIFGK